MFQTINADLVVHLPPKFSFSVLEGIKDYLSTMLTKYVPELKSVVLSYDNIKSYAKTAVIKSESPFLHFKINADFTVFKPVKDSVVGKNFLIDQVGVVTKVSPDHVACSVYGFFTASIYADQFPEKSWTWNKDSNVWEAQSSKGLISMKKDCIIKFKIAGWTISDSMISIKGSLVDTDKSKLGILDSTGIAPCPSFIVEPITDAMDVDALEENGKDGIIDPFADDEIEEMNEKNAVVILAEDSQALPIVSPVKKETETMKKSAMKKGKVAPVILAQDSQEYLSQEVPATQEVAIKPKKEKKSKQDLKEKVKEKVEEEKQEVVVPQKKVKKSASSKKQAAGNEDGENEMMKSPESLVAAIIEPIAEKDAHKKSKSKSKTKVPKGPEETAKDEVESKVKKANSEITESQSATVLETLKEKKSAKKRKSPEDGGDSSKKSKKKGKKTAQ